MQTRPESKATNAQFAEHDPHFREACRLAQVKPTKRQASKWRNAKGLAFKTWKALN